ncbi:MAG: HEAT repeat domain-containing protein [Deltaproteobacteria bacterium]|jgi:ATP/ADP translocase|nr:HEAT repeat domain-containing protein [Deltaproteobacteria bacterium]MBW2529878.1 HEAT repeat domain-containing protein [Deltaproteobacteria bacterium]
MTAAVARFVDVRTGELRPVMQAFFTLFCIIAGHTALETARDALFLGTLPASRLPLVYLILAALGLLVPWYSVAFIRRFGRRDSVAFTMMVDAFGTTWLHFQPITPVMVFVIYAWSGLLATVMVVQFWMLAGQLFTVAQGKRLFPLVAAGGVLGATVGGVISAGLLQAIRGGAGVHGAVRGDPAGAHTLLLLAAGLFVLAAIFVASASTDDRTGRLPTQRPKLPPALLEGLAVLRREPYVARIALMVALGTGALLATDYLFKLVAKQSVPADQLGTFFAWYYAAMNGAALLMQLFVAMRLVQRLGVVAAVAVLPLCLLGGGAGVLVLGGGLLAVLLTKGADGALRHSLHRVSSELLFMPLSREVREPSKSLVDSVVVRGSQALTAAVILAIAAAELESIRTVAGLVAGLAAAWVLAAVALKRRYLDLFRKKLSKGSLDPTLRFEDLDVGSVESVMAALSSPDEVRVVAAMDLIAQSGRTRLIPALILYHESTEVLLRALEIVPQRDRDDWGPHAERLLRHDDGAVRLAALRALGRAGILGPLEGLLDSSDTPLRAAAAFFIAREDHTVAPKKHGAVAAVLSRIPRHHLDTAGAPSIPPPGGEQESTELRLAMLDTLREYGDERWVDVLLHLADCLDGKVLEQAALAMARVSDPRFVPLLIRRLAQRQGRGAAREALVQFGDTALEALGQALADPETSPAVRLHIPRTIARFGTQQAADLLTAYLATGVAGAVRYKVLRGLGSMAARYPVVLDRVALAAEVDRNLIESLRLLSLLTPLEQRLNDSACCEGLGRRALASSKLVVGLLRDKHAQALERAFRFFQLLHRGEDVRGIYIALQSADPRRRAAAMEFLDALASTETEKCRDLFRLVADDLEPAERVTRAAAYLPERPQDAMAALRLLMGDVDTSLASLAAYHANTLRLAELDAELDELCEQRPSLGMFGELRPAVVQPSSRSAGEGTGGAS